MSLINKDQLAHIPLYYLEKTSKNGFVKYVILEDDKAQEMLQDEAKKAEVKVLNTNWKVLTWKQQNVITKKATVFTNDGQQDLDLFEYRDQRIKTCLHSWDLTDDRGVPIAATAENIDQLPSEFVFALINKYDKATSLTEEEQKN